MRLGRKSAHVGSITYAEHLASDSSEQGAIGAGRRGTGVTGSGPLVVSCKMQARLHPEPFQPSKLGSSGMHGAPALTIIMTSRTSS